MEDVSHEYIEREIELGRDLTGNERALLASLNKSLPHKDLYFEETCQRLICYLNSLSPEKLSEVIEAGVKKYDLSAFYAENNLFNPFFRIQDLILEIGSYGIRYRKRRYLHYADERKVLGRKEKISARGSIYYAQDNDFDTQRNSVPEGLLNTIIRGDSEKILSSLPDNCIDLIITSPPYNFGMEYGTSQDGIDWNQYFEKLFAVFREGIRVLVYGGRFLVNVQPLFSDYIPIHHIISSFFMEQKMIWKGEILWEKNNYNCKYTSWGSWKSPSSPYLKYTWEFLEIFCKGDLKKAGLPEDIDITDDEFKSWVVARWSIGPEKRMKQYHHPAMFPEELVHRSLKLFSYQHDIILDPFNGAGTTTAVARRLNRRYIGIDVSEEYCRIAKERMDGQQHLV